MIYYFYYYQQKGEQKLNKDKQSVLGFGQKQVKNLILYFQKYINKFDLPLQQT